MVNKDAKELRVKALQNIESYTKCLKEIIDDQNIVSRSKFDERLLDAERKFKECKVRSDIFEQYYIILLNRDIDELEKRLAFSLIYSALEKETEQMYKDLYTSCYELEYLYNAMKTSVDATKVGFDYFEHKFKEEYNKNTELWSKSSALTLDIKKLNKEANDARVKEFGDELEEELEA